MTRNRRTTLALIALATLVLALVSCLVFSVVSLERRHKRRRTRRTAQGARSRSLKGGALTYARLSARRGGFRSLVPVLAGIVLLVMFVVYMVLTVRQSFRDTVQAGGADEARVCALGMVSVAVAQPVRRWLPTRRRAVKGVITSPSRQASA